MVRTKTTALDLLHRIVLDTSCLEPGLRLLTFTAVGGGEEFVSWGFDAARRALVLYVSPFRVRRRELLDVLARLAHRAARATGGSALEIAGEREGRVLAVASGFVEPPVASSPLPATLGNWLLELWTWREESICGRRQVRFEKVGVQADVEPAPRDAETDEEKPDWAGPVAISLTREEVESLMGRGPK